MTPFALDHPAVSAYLQRLDAATAHLPEDERIEIQEGIRSHLIAALAEAHTDADMHQALETLGAPEEIVALTSGETAPPAPQPIMPAPASPSSARGALEVIAVILLLIGGIVVPFVGWVVGVVLLWISKAWTTGEKVLGTLVLPGGLGASALLLLTTPVLAVQSCTSGGGGATDVTTGSPNLVLPDPTLEVCSGGVAPWLVITILVVSVIAPIATAIYLLRAAGKRPAPTI